MLREAIFENYGLYVKLVQEFHETYLFQDHHSLYFFIRANDLTNEEVQEISMMSRFLSEQDMVKYAYPLQNNNEKFLSEIDNDNYILYLYPTHDRQNTFVREERLASFHKKGMGFPYQLKYRRRIGNWPELWTSRLEQLEMFVMRRMREEKHSPFEKQLFETFPYFLGVSENAIQYVSETLSADQRGESYIGTICHKSYSQKNEQYPLLPHDWIYDHPVRDLAEWVRAKYWKKEHMNAITQFIDEYERISPLSTFSKRLLFGRLLFPLKYFRVIEGYYAAASNERLEIYEKEFYSLLERSDEYEQFLSYFSFYRVADQTRITMPNIPWLVKEI